MFFVQNDTMEVRELPTPNAGTSSANITLLRSRGRKGTGLFLLFLVCLAIGAAVIHALSQSRLSAYRRYVSPPLPDGSRYTFLYPAYLKTVHEGWHNKSFNVVQSARIENVPEEFTLMDRLRGLLGIQYLPKRGSITLVVCPADNYGSGIHDKRIDDRFSSGDQRQHNIRLTDARSKLRLEMYHEGWFHPDLFDQADAAVSSSLSFLPPGATTPR